MQDDFPNDDARLSVPWALEVVVVGGFSASCWGMRNCDHLNCKQAAEPLSQLFQWAKERKVGGKSEMDAGGSRKSIAKINK